MGIARFASAFRGRPSTALCWTLVGWLLLASSSAFAFSSQDCVLAVVAPTTVSTDPGTPVDFTITATSQGGSLCSSAFYSLSLVSDSTSGSSAGPVSASVAPGSPAVVTVTPPSSPQGGGSVTYQVDCSSGCELSSPTPPQFTVNVNDVYSLSINSPSSFFSVSGNSSTSLSVQVIKNVSTPVTDATGDVCFDFSSNDFGATLTGGNGPCGANGRSATPNGSGIATVMLNAPADICGDTLIDVSTINVSSTPVQFDGSGNGTVNFALTSGDNQTGFTNQNFGQPLVVQLTCNSAPYPNSQINWSVNNGPVTFSGASTTSVNTDAGGFASVTLTGGASSGAASVHACPIDAAGCDIFTDFNNLTVSNYYQLSYTTPASGNTSATVNTNVALTANLSSDSSPASSQFIFYSVLTGPDPGTFSPSATVSTDVNGDAPVTWSTAVEGDYVIRATYSGPAARASGGAAPVDLDFGVTIRKLRALNSPSAVPSSGQSGDSSTLTITATDDGAAASGATINWEVVSGDATLASATSVTDGSGNASNTLTFGPTPGNVVVRAYRLDPVDGVTEVATQTFPTLEDFRYVLSFPSAGDQTPSGEIGSTIAMNALLQRQGASTTPVSGATVHYHFLSMPTGSSASLSPAQDGITDSSGLTSVGVAADVAGSYVVRAEYPIGSATTFQDYTVTAIAHGLEAHAQPSGPNYSEETITGVVAKAYTTDGSTFTGEDGVLVNFQIISGAATFVGGGSTASVTTSGGGFATTPDIVLSRDLSDVVIQATSGALPAVQFTLPVTASTYSVRLDSSQANPASTLTNSPTTLAVVIERTGSGAPVAISGGTVGWSASGGSLSAPTSSSDANGKAVVDFSAASAGTYTVTASYDPAFGGIAPASTQVTVNVTMTIVKTLSKPGSNSGDGQSGTVGNALPMPLIAIAQDSGTAASGVQVNWTVSGDASLSAAQTTTDPSGSTSVTVTLGSTPGTVTVTASRSDAPTATTSYVLTATPPATEVLAITSGDGQVSQPNQAGQPLDVLFTSDGAPVLGKQISWSLVTGDATLSRTLTTTDASGHSQIDISFGATPGPVIVHASAGTASVDFNLAIAGGQLQIDSGNGQVSVPGAQLANDFVVRVLSADGSPLAGETVQWQVVQGGGSLSTDSSVTDSNGRAATRLTLGTATGTNVVRASYGGSSVDFTAIATGSTVIAQSGSGQTGPLQTRADAPLVATVRAVDGAPIAGRVLNWSVRSGSAQLDATSTNTDSDGHSSNGITFGDTVGLVVVRATDGETGSFAEFMLQASQPTLSGVVQGDEQTGRPGEPLPDDFVVSLGAAAKSLGGVVVHWEVTQGGGTLSSELTPTDANGEARNHLTLGPNVGSNEVRAFIPGGGEVRFHATAAKTVGVLKIVSGDDQTVPTNQQSQPLVVELVDDAGNPLPGINIEWTVREVQVGGVSRTNAELEQQVVRTDEHGQASNIAKVLLPGPAEVRASVADSNIGSVTFNLTGGIANIPTLDPTEEQTGGAVDNACAALAALETRTPEQEDFYQRCLELVDNAGDNPDEVENALDQLPPQLGDTMAEAGFETLETQFDNMQTRFQLLHQQGGAGGQFNVGLWTPTGVLPLGFLPSAFGDGEQDATSSQEVGADFDRWGFFATGTIGRGKVDADGRNAGFSFDTSGLTAGVDYRFSDRLVAGVSAGFARHGSDLRHDLGSVDTTGWTISGYASWYHEKNWYLDGMLSLGNSSYDLERRVQYSITALDGSRTEVDQRARGSTDGSLLGASFSFGRDFQKGPWSLSTYLRGDYSRLSLDSYDERMIENQPGAGLGLHFRSRSLDSLSSAFGGKATYVMSRDWGILMPGMTLEWQHEFKDDPKRLTATFINDPMQTPIEQFGTPVDSNYFNVGLGVSALFPGGRSFYLYYEELVGASRLSQGTLSIGGRFEF